MMFTVLELFTNLSNRSKVSGSDEVRANILSTHFRFKFWDPVVIQKLSRIIEVLLI